MNLELQDYIMLSIWVIIIVALLIVEFQRRKRSVAGTPSPIPVWEKMCSVPEILPLKVGPSPRLRSA